MLLDKLLRKNYTCKDLVFIWQRILRTGLEIPQHKMHPSGLRQFSKCSSITVVNMLPVKHNTPTQGEISKYPLHARFEESRTFSVQLKQYVNITKGPTRSITWHWNLHAWKIVVNSFCYCTLFPTSYFWMCLKTTAHASNLAAFL